MSFKFNPLTGRLDLVGDDSGAPPSPSNKYQSSFTTGDWVLVSGNYELTLTKATHNIDSPVVTVYETVGLFFEEVDVFVKINGSDDVVISVSATPDLRFNGLIIIN